MKLITFATLLFAASALAVAIDNDWGTTLEEFLPDALSKRSNIPHLDTFEDKLAFEVFADDMEDDTTDLSLTPRSTDKLFDTLEARATCNCLPQYKSCCPKWDRCLKPPPDQITCCKLKTGTVACKKPTSCCYNGCCKSGYKCCVTNGGVFFCGKGGCN